MALGQFARRIFNRIGVDVYRYPMITSRGYARARTLEHLGINVVLDVGANVGQYGRELLEYGYRGRLISFEPMTREFALLRATAAKAARTWECRQLGLADSDGTARINVAGTFSSILSKSPDAVDSIAWAPTGVEEIRVARLDSLWPELYKPGDKVWMKMDVQGYEMHVLNGAPEALKDIAALEMEMAMSPLYSQQPTYLEMQDRMAQLGFGLWSLNPGARHLQTGRLLEVDGTFVRQA
jgi:FkbM family methyltransferase